MKRFCIGIILLLTSTHSLGASLHHLRTKQGAPVALLQIPETPPKVGLLISFKKSGWFHDYFNHEFLLNGLVAEVLQENFQNSLNNKRYAALKNSGVQVQFAFPIDIREHFVIQVESPSEHLPETLSLLMQCLTHPSLSEQKLKKKIDTHLKALEKSESFKIFLDAPPLFLAQYALFSLIAQQHPILLSEVGAQIQKSLLHWKSKNIQRYIQTHFTQDQMQIHAVANLSPEALLSILNVTVSRLAPYAPQFIKNRSITTQKQNQTCTHHIFRESDTTLLCFGQSWEPLPPYINSALARVLEHFFKKSLTLKTKNAPILGLGPMLSGCLTLPNAEVPKAIAQIKAFFQILTTQKIEPKETLALQKAFLEALSEAKREDQKIKEPWLLPPLEPLSKIEEKEITSLLSKLFHAQMQPLDKGLFPNAQGLQSNSGYQAKPISIHLQNLELEDLLGFIRPPDQLSWVEVGPINHLNFREVGLDKDYGQLNPAAISNTHEKIRAHLDKKLKDELLDKIFYNRSSQPGKNFLEELKILMSMKQMLDSARICDIYIDLPQSVKEMESSLRAFDPIDKTKTSPSLTLGNPFGRPCRV